MPEDKTITGALTRASLEESMEMIAVSYAIQTLLTAEDELKKAMNVGRRDVTEEEKANALAWLGMCVKARMFLRSHAPPFAEERLMDAPEKEGERK